MGRRLRIATFNAAIQDLRLLGRSWYCPVAWPRERLRQLPAALASLDADIVCLQEVFHRPLQDWLRHALAPVFPHVAGLQPPGPSLQLGNELMVLSRFALHGARLHRFAHAAREERLFTSKGFQHVQVALPGLGAVDLLNVHTTAGGARAQPESPEMEAIRARQISQLLDAAMPLPLAFIVGDLNAGPHTSTHIYIRKWEPGASWTCLPRAVARECPGTRPTRWWPGAVKPICPRSTSITFSFPRHWRNA
jgi:endonuclease/exonuclease/phosphatase family metal-dependent hydrolase